MNKNMRVSKLLQAIRRSHTKPSLAIAVCTAALLTPLTISAQETENDQQADSTEVIEVSGVRSTIQSSNAIKRESTEIVDGISANDIGDLPALSIGEALETLTGASSHREQGGATEISIRGLGPYLGSTVMNGREASNGSGDRSVNFSQFPSELFNKVAIYKTQSASMVEGGVSGQISLETLKPIDFGKRRVQIDYKGNYNPDNADLENPVDEFGQRITFSYVDQFKSDTLGQFGISLGLQRNDQSNPEQEARTGTTFDACRIDPSFAGAINGSRQDCEDNGGRLDLVEDPQTGVSPDGDTPFVFARSQNSFRQNITDDTRESIFAAIQWQPNDDVEVNLDYQKSDRDFNEIRNDLVFAEINHLDGFTVDQSERLGLPLVATANGELRQFTVLQNIETNSQFAERIEEYEGGGINVNYQISDSFSVAVDVSSSETLRTENIIQTRLQSEDLDLVGNDVLGADGNGEVLTGAQIFANGSLVPTWTLQNFDVNYHNAFADEARTRLDLNQSRYNKISGARIDLEYLPDMELITSIKAGVRGSRVQYESIPRVRNQFTFSDDALADANLACRNNEFPESEFLTGETGGAPLFTNVDSDGNVISAGTGNTYATFDAMCLANTLLGTLTLDDGTTPRSIENSFPDVALGEIEDIESVDVTEETLAFYVQADYDTFVGDYGVRGNFGVRVVQTDVSSRGFRGALFAERNDLGLISDIVPVPGELELVEGGGDYTEVLPSVNLIVDVNDDVMVRSAIYRGISRPDPADMGFGRNFGGIDEDEETGEISDLVARASATGNPFLQPFTSWNVDLATEWYANEDTLLAAGLYYKRFEGGFENTNQTETFIVDGEELETIVSTTQVSDDTSVIYGLEFTATHSFAWLDNWMNGFGFKLSYNYADSDFEFEDEDFGSSTFVNDDGELTNTTGIVAPANLFGFSEHVLFGQVYYQYEGFNISVNYKYRSEYFNQYLDTPGAIRFIGDTEVFEIKSSYRLNRNWKFSVGAINIFDEPKRQYRPTIDNFSEINVYGPRIFFGVNYRI